MFIITGQGPSIKIKNAFYNLKRNGSVLINAIWKFPPVPNWDEKEARFQYLHRRSLTVTEVLAFSSSTMIFMSPFGSPKQKPSIANRTNEHLSGIWCIWRASEFNQVWAKLSLLETDKQDQDKS